MRVKPTSSSRLFTRRTVVKSLRFVHIARRASQRVLEQPNHNRATQNGDWQQSGALPVPCSPHNGHI